MIHVTDVKYIKDYLLQLSFDDGTKGVIDLYSHLHGTIFQPLKDKDVFNKVSLDTELRTITWPNGADFAPEFLKENLILRPGK